MDEINVMVDALNMQGKYMGDLAGFFQHNRGLDVMSLRPWRTDDGKSYISVYKGGDPKVPTSYINKLVTNSTLRQDEWKELDTALLAVSRDRLVGINDLVSNGLVYNLGNAMGTMVLQYDDVSDAMTADLTMDGITRSQGDRPIFTRVDIPIPVLHSDFEINLRALEASRRMGAPLSTIYVELAGKKIAEKLEDMLFTDTSYSFAGGTIYSYLNHPDRNTVNLAVNWDAAAMTAALILADVYALKQASMTAMHYGPWMLYVPKEYDVILDADYDPTTPGSTIRSRIKMVEGIKDIRVVDRLAENTVLLVEMKPQTVRLISGLPMQTVQWSEEGKFVEKFKVIAIQVPQIRSDQEGRSGIVQLS